MRDVFIGIGELSETLGVHRQTVWRWHNNGVLPPVVKLGPSKRGWWRSTLESNLPGFPTGEESKEKSGTESGNQCSAG
jgi:Predicted transcriptional regulator